MSQTTWEADKMLDVYIYDYLVKRKLHGTAKAFQAEAKVSSDPVAIDAPGGFLFEWWSVFWDIFIARTNDRHSEAAASYIETQAMKARELQQQQQQQQPKQQQQQQQQMQQILMQRQAQQQNQQQQQTQQQQPQRRDGNQILNGTASGLVGNDHFIRPNSANANSIAAKLYEERSKLPPQRDSLDAAATKQKMSDSAGQLLDANHASMLKSAALGGHPAGQSLLGTSGGISGNVQQFQNRSQQLLVSTQDIKPEMNAMINPRAAGSEGSLVELHGPNNQLNVPAGSSQSGNSLPLKGYPLPGLDQLRPGFLQQKSMMQSSQALNPLQVQQLMLQAQAAQQNFQTSSSNDELKRFRMLFNNRNMGLGKDGQINPVGDLVPNIGSPLQVPSVSRPDAEMLMKLQQLQNNQQYLQNSIPRQQPQNLNSHIQQDKMMPSGSLNIEGNMSNTFQGNDQGSKSQIARKRKQPGSSSGPANSSGTANTAGPSPSSPSTPSTHTPGDAMSMPTLPQNGGGSKSMLIYNSDNLSSMNSAQNHLTDIDRFVDDGALDDNIDSFLSHDEQDPQETVTRCGDVGKGFSFKEIKLITASTNKVECCNFSSDGKLLATGGYDKKAVLWCMESFTVKSTLEEHSQWITDVRFSPSMSRLATSSADKTVRIWDADNPGYSLRTFMGHSSIVTSLDFHPNKEDLVSSCDNNSEIRYWSIKNGGCAGVFKGGATQLRFQPRSGRLLAAAADNIVSIIDVETQVCRHKLQGHKNQVHSVCWDPSGEFLASVSDDLVRVWTVGSGNKCEIVHELNCMGNKYNTCAFHPAFPSLLIIGCYETLEVWNTRDSKTTTIRAHEKLVSSLAVSTASGLVASASHDKYVKIWK